MKIITIIFYILVLLILSIGVYFYAVSHRYSYHNNGSVRIDNFTGHAQYYNVADTIKAQTANQSEQQTEQAQGMGSRVDTQPTQRWPVNGAPGITVLSFYQPLPKSYHAATGGKPKPTGTGLRNLIIDAGIVAGYQISKNNVELLFDRYKDNPIGFATDFWMENNTPLSASQVKYINRKYLAVGEAR